MPAPFTVTLIDNQEHPTRFRSSGNGFEGERWYRVDTDQADRAIDPAQSPGVPVREESWSAGQYASCQCYSVEAQRQAGRDQGTRVGHCWVRASYATPSDSFEIFPTEPGSKWTEVVAGQTSQNINYGLLPSENNPINNGDGLNINVGLIQYIVTRNWPVSYLTDLTRLNTLQTGQLFNDAAIVLPPVLGTTAALSLQAKEAQFVGFDPQVVGRSLRIRYTLSVGLSPRYSWRKKKPDGGYISSVLSATTYKSASFAGLW